MLAIYLQFTLYTMYSWRSWLRFQLICDPLLKQSLVDLYGCCYGCCFDVISMCVFSRDSDYFNSLFNKCLTNMICSWHNVRWLKNCTSYWMVCTCFIWLIICNWLILPSHSGWNYCFNMFCYIVQSFGIWKQMFY